MTSLWQIGREYYLFVLVFACIYNSTQKMPGLGFGYLYPKMIYILRKLKEWLTEHIDEVDHEFETVNGRGRPSKPLLCQKNKLCFKITV